MATSGSWNIEWASGYWGSRPKSYHWSGNFNRSGNTITLSNMQLWFTISGTGQASGITDSVTVTGGSAQTVTWNFSTSSTSNVVSLNNTSFSVSTAATSATIQCAIAGENTGSTTIQFDSGGSAPSGLSVSDITPLEEGFSAIVSVTDWGGAGDATTRCRELQCWTYDASTLAEPRRYHAEFGNELTGLVVVDNSGSGALQITSNTRYTLGIWATNGVVATGSQRVGDYVTLAKTATITVSSLTQNSATLTYNISADGGFYTKTYEYSLDGTNWTTFATVASGSATSGTINLTGLDPHTAYTLITRVTTAAGVNTDSGTNFRTVGTIATYGAVPVQTVTGVAGEIRAGGAGNVSSFDGATFWSAAQSAVDPNKEMDYLWFSVSVYPDKATLYLYYKDGTHTSLPGVTHYADAAIYGLSGTATAAGIDYIDLTPVYSTSYVSARTQPWYGSVNSQSTLIQKIYGSTGGVTKRVY